MMKIVNMKTNQITCPLGFSMNSISLSWQVEECSGKKQKNARIEISEDNCFKKVVFDSGLKNDISSLSYVPELKQKPYTRYYWRVYVEADNGECTWSPSSWFETAKLDMPWDGKWISDAWLHTENPVFSKKIVLSEDLPDGRIYVCGLGIYEVYIDGKKVGNEYFAPGCNHYTKWLQYQTYEVSLEKGEHQIEVSLGNGWYKGKFSLNKKENLYGNKFKLLFELRNGTELICASDDQWKVRCGSIVRNNIYDGEIYDPAGTDAKEYPVTVLNDGYELLMARLSLPVVVKETLTIKEVIHTPAGETVLDMGQNFAGFVRFRCREPKGTKIRLQFGEILQDGNFYRDNLRTALAEYVYISDGTDRIVEPHFTFFGFRYVKITGLSMPVRKEDFEGCVLYSDMEQTGMLRTDHDKVNQLISNAMWGQKSNYLDVPTDCPQRDERLGWTCDAHVFSGTACFNMNSYAFLNKYMWDMKCTQEDIGHVTNVVPPFDQLEMATSAWGDAATIIPWTLYRYYGNVMILKQQFESMKAWVEAIKKEDDRQGGKRLWNPDFTFGDWLAKDHENVNERLMGGTDTEYISSAYYYYSTKIVAMAAEILEKKEDADYYKKLCEEIRAAIQKEFFSPNGRLAVTTQTGYILALQFGFAPENAKKSLSYALEKKLKDNNGYLKTGFIGTAYICQALSRNHLNQLAYGLLLNEGVPSWLYAVNMGATTIWERWNSLLEDGKINGTDMNSFNHYAYGSVVEWMYRYMAGINELTPGFKRARIEPMPDRRIQKVDAVYQSAAGKYEVHWTIEGNTCRIKVAVPFDAEAEFIAPFGDGSVQILTAGTYEFTIIADELVIRLSVDSTLAELMQEPKAAPILDKYIDGWRNIPSAFTKDTPRNMANTPFNPGLAEKLEDMDKELRDLAVGRHEA